MLIVMILVMITYFLDCFVASLLAMTSSRA